MMGRPKRCCCCSCWWCGDDSNKEDASGEVARQVGLLVEKSMGDKVDIGEEWW
jgi:hypothetical protein